MKHSSHYSRMSLTLFTDLPKDLFTDLFTDAYVSRA